MYHALIDHLNKKYDYFDIGLCKETIEMWEKIGLDYKNIKCNCTL
jgi:spore photoproduct lyase